MTRLTRRRLLAGSVPLLGAGAVLHARVPHTHPRDAAAQASEHGGHAGAALDGHADFRAGETVDHRANGFDPSQLLRDFDWGHTQRLPSGRVVREWELEAVDREVEVMPGVRFAAWTYNGRIPGPTLRCREGDRLRITFTNGSAHAHTIHFHGIHPAEMDGVPGVGAGEIPPGGRTVYEFDARPAGLHLYHCHVRPLAEHLAKGLYGAFIVDPAAGRPDADEMVMVMNGFDTNFDRSNEVYAANTIGFAYMHVGVIPVALGMLWLPWVRRISPHWVRGIMGVTVGLLAFLAIDATLEGLELAGDGSQAFGGAALVLLGGAVSYLLLSGVSAWQRRRVPATRTAGATGGALALLVAVGIGLHNLGEGVAIGSAYSAGALQAGEQIISDYPRDNTTEGLAIVAPMAAARPSLGRLLALGLIAGAPAVLGTWIGAATVTPSVAAFLFGFGAGAIAQVVVQLAPALRDDAGRTLHPAAVGAVLAGMAIMFATGLLVSV